jgi:hypothetical protein
MHIFLLALGLTLAVSIPLCLVLYYFMNDVKIALEIASLPLIGIHHLYETLEKAQGRRNVAVSPENVQTYEGFSMPWYAMTIYGTIGFFGLIEASGVLGVWIAALGLSQFSQLLEPQSLSQGLLMVAAIPATMVLRLVGAYLIGAWIGTRCVKRGVIAVVTAVVFSATLAIVGDHYLLSDAEFQGFYGFPKSKSNILAMATGLSLFLAIPSVVGFWRGRRLRLTKYLRYLLNILPSETRGTIVNLACEEAQRLSLRREGQELSGVVKPVVNRV